MSNYIWTEKVVGHAPLLGGDSIELGETVEELKFFDVDDIPRTF